MKKQLLLTCLLIAPVALFAQIDYNLYVASDGSAEYTSIQEALNATKSFPDKRITIHIKNGIYNEKVRVYSWNNKLTFKGESVDSTIITYDDYFDKIDLGRNSTFHTYTMKVESNDFKAVNLTIRNTAGPVGQAVALHVEGDRVAFVNCRIEGHQDTYYGAGEGHRQYFKDCFVEGTTDFIFGQATVVYEDCEIKSLADSYITAASTPKDQPFGLVFLNCSLTAAPDVDEVYLGRPWRDYAKTAFINCEMGDHIIPEGWNNWSTPSREQTTFYVEYGNSGKGAKLDQRVPWMHKLDAREAEKYTIDHIFRGWLPSQR